jgi:hypothetical protein
MDTCEEKNFMMNEPLKRSKLGIASLLIAVGTFVLASFVVIVALMLSDRHGSDTSKAISDSLFNLFLIAPPAMHFVGLILGIIALFQKRRGKVFAVFGIILNILFPAGAVLLILGLLSIAPGPR